MEEFVVNALAKEIKEFHEDKKGVVETKVKLVAEARKQMAKMKEAFITKSAKVVESAVNKKLAEELSTLKEDISKARTINFGKKIFEAFASEYQNSYLNEKSETAKLMKVVDETTLKLKDAEKAVNEKEAVIESKNAESKRQADLMERKEKMAEMLKPLGKSKGEVMAQLLESVQTNKLQASFDKYLPHVMTDKPIASVKETKVITEAKGNREQREDAELTSFRKLAGI
jgi:23S rRNA U2552 (ribose-2'-O)-methylase RlmE/FtsJ